MPYIEPHQRRDLDDRMADLLDWLEVAELQPGEKNYILTRVAIAMTGKRYADHEAVLGRLVAVTLEWWRRVVVPYEQEKQVVNGDVYK